MKEETRRDKFVRLAEARTNAVLEKIRVLSNLANSNRYEYTLKDVKEIFNALEQALDNSKRKFESTISTHKTFKLN